MLHIEGNMEAQLWGIIFFKGVEGLNKENNHRKR
jgi:hypothetical protein